MMRLYDYPASANCYKARLLAALLDLPYERVPVDIFGGETLTDAFGELNPLRETPVLELDGGDVVTQSSAILWLLAEGTAFMPATALGRAQAVQWLLLEQELVMTGIGGARFRRLTGRDPEIVRARQTVGRQALALLDERLSSREWLVGDRPSLVDVAVFAYAHVAAEAGLDLAAHRAVVAWIDRVQSLPGFMDDLAPYPANAHEGAGRSIYG